MEFQDVIRTRRSVRKFTPSDISDEALTRICEAGRIAPSGCNIQNRDFVVIRDRDNLGQLHDRLQPDFRNAAAAIALVMDTTPTKFGSYWIEDASAATENMLLAIVDEGYDSVWIEGTLLPHEAWAKGLLGVPDEKRLYIILPIGKAAKPGDMAPKKALDEMVHWDRY
jgi:nitroreductase